MSLTNIYRIYYYDNYNVSIKEIKQMRSDERAHKQI